MNSEKQDNLHELYQELVNYPDDTRLVLMTTDNYYHSVIVRREWFFCLLTTKIIKNRPASCQDYLDIGRITKEQNSKDRCTYNSRVALSSFSPYVEDLLEGVIHIRPADKSLLDRYYRDRYKQNNRPIGVFRDLADRMEMLFNYLHNLPHETVVEIIDTNNHSYPAIVYKTPHRHILLTNARVPPKPIFENIEDITKEYGADNYIGIGRYIPDILSQDCKWIDKICIPEEYLEMNPKDFSSGPILYNGNINPGGKKMSKLIVKDITIKNISEASLRKHSAAIVADLGYDIDPENKSVMWPNTSQIDLTAVPVNVTPATIKEIFLNKIKDEPAEDSKWMIALAKYNLIESVTLVEKNAKG